MEDYHPTGNAILPQSDDMGMAIVATVAIVPIAGGMNIQGKP